MNVSVTFEKMEWKREISVSEYEEKMTDGVYRVGLSFLYSLLYRLQRYASTLGNHGVLDGVDF